jgi:hypothetical protein
MKTLEQLYEEIQSNEELKKEFTASIKENTTDDFLKKHDCDANIRSVMAFMNNLKDGELSEDDLESVAGGDGHGGFCGTSMTCGW